VVTVDDGFHDFFDVAVPIFRKYSIPAIVYLVADFIEHRHWMWWNVIDYCVLHTKCGEVDWNGHTLPISSDQDRARVCNFICENAKLLTVAERKHLVDTFPDCTEVALPPHPPSEFAPMSWEEICTLSAQGFEFGSHTMSHPLLTQVDEEGMVREVNESKALLENRLQRPIEHFCYPNGNFDQRCVTAVSRAGYRSAVTCLTGMNSLSTPALELRRLSADLSAPDWYFHEMAAGIVR
jgi:peptidoglycan/xylan/chitin deacetylase (PgdA/CDA1 family)